MIIQAQRRQEILADKFAALALRPDTINKFIELLIMESTYGDRNHENSATRVNTLNKALDKAFKDNGIVYIPAFSLCRTQELIYGLDRIKTKIPVFIDSPLGLKITKLYATWKSSGTKKQKT